MIQLEIKSVRFDLDERIKKYVGKKIGRLDRYVPKRARNGIKGKVILKEDDGKSKNRFTCDAVIILPHGTITAEEATVNMFAAVDIVEAKLKAQCLKYKEKATDHHSRRERWYRKLRLRRRNRLET